MRLRDAECAAWMVAFVHAREQYLKRGNSHGHTLDHNAAVEADRLIEIMRERCDEPL